MSQAEGGTRIVSVNERLLLTELKRRKPQYAPYLATIQAVTNEILGPMGFLAYGIAKGAIDYDLVDRYVVEAKALIGKKLTPLGVGIDLTATPTNKGLAITWAAIKQQVTDNGSYVIQGLSEDFSDDWVESLTLAKSRWSRFVNSLTPDMADKILSAAQIGYEEFMLNESPTPKQILAVTKHKIRLLSVDRNLYVNRTKEAIQRYELGYKDAKVKYGEVMRYVGDALRAATRLTISVFKVL